MPGLPSFLESPDFIQFRPDGLLGFINPAGMKSKRG